MFFQKLAEKFQIKRVKFNEITESEIKQKINIPEEIEQNLVDAQQGRRVIDRIFGYKLSPLLWKRSSQNYRLEESNLPP